MISITVFITYTVIYKMTKVVHRNQSDTETVTVTGQIHSSLYLILLTELF